MANPIQANHRTLFGRFKFNVTINGIGNAAFQRATGLTVTVEMMEYWEGGAIVAFKEAGRMVFDDITLERGVSYNEDFIFWLEEVGDVLANAPYGAGQLSPFYKRDPRINQQERDGSTVLYYDVKDAFPVTYSAGDMDNTVSEVSLESVTLANRFWKRTTLAAPNT